MPKLEDIYARWVVFLSGFDIAAIYRKVMNNEAADYLSRHNYTSAERDALLEEAPFVLKAG